MTHNKSINRDEAIKDESLATRRSLFRKTNSRNPKLKKVIKKIRNFF